MELRDTVEMMQSADCKERFRAEYMQVKIRYEKLNTMLENWERLNFVPTCPKWLLHDQVCAMRHYLFVLERRAKLEKVDL